MITRWLIRRLWLWLGLPYALVMGSIALGQAVIHNDEMAFMSNRDRIFATWDIFLMDIQRGIIINLTHEGVHWPVPPDADSVIVYEGRAMTPVPRSQQRFPIWSPDGRYIAFHANRLGSYDIYVIGANGHNLRRITTNNREDLPTHVTEAFASWSPDGRYLAFHATHTGAWNLYLLPIDEAQLQPAPNLTPLVTESWDGIIQLTDTMGTEVGLSWSPDGEHVAYYAAPQTNDLRAVSFDIYTARVIDKQLVDIQQLTKRSGTNTNPQWSPDGRQLVFVSNRDGDDDLYLMDADGGNIRQLTNHPATDYDPRWLPDGSGILFTSDRSGNSDIYLLNLADNTLQQLTFHPAEDRAPAWRP